MTRKFDVVVVGATGMVGSTTLAILEERGFPINNLYLVASHRSAGETIEFKGKAYFVEDICHFDFSKTQIAFFSAGSDVSAEYALKAAAAGNVVIDKTSYFRYNPEIPLLVPEVNTDQLVHYKNKNIIANPNCSTIPVVMALKPIYDAVGISRVNVTTYQSVSGSGKSAVDELAKQTGLLLNGQPVTPKVYPQQIAFNVLPHIDAFQENGYTKEEMKVIWETQKLLNDTTLMVNPTAVRVPVFFGHSAVVNIELKNKLTAAAATALLKQSPGIKVIEGQYPYPTPVHDAAGQDDVFVGRIREDVSHPMGLNLWVVTDNLRKGAALNAVQIAEKLTEIL